jgi:hypothetical protein
MTDTSLGHERGVLEPGTQYDALPQIRLTVAAGRQLLWRSKCYLPEEDVILPEPHAVRAVHDGAATLAAGQKWTGDGQAYLKGLQEAQLTGDFRPRYGADRSWS